MTNPCKKCGGLDRYKDGRCVSCQRERVKKWNDAHPEKIRASGRKWQDSNAEKARSAVNRWVDANREKVAEYKKRWHTDNRERNNAVSREYQKSHPEVYRAISETRRTRKAQSEGSFTAAEWRALCKQYDNHCCYPGCERTDLHADHVVPLAKGGRGDISNIQPLCSHHNLSKGTKSTDYRNSPGLINWIQRKLFG